MKKTLTKILCILLAAVLFLVLLPRLDLASVATAETAPRQDAPEAIPQPDAGVNASFTNEPCGDHLVATLQNGKLTITGTGIFYESRQLPWDTCRSEVTSVSLPDGLWGIPYWTFRDTKLTELSVPDTVNNILYMAFFNTPLRKAELGKGLNRIWFRAFGQTQLKELVVRNPDCLVYAGDDSAEDLTSLGSTPASLKVFSKHVGGRGLSYPSKIDEEFNGDDYYYIENFAVKAGCKFYALDVFSDVAEKSFCELPVAWAVGEGITTGASGTKFSPNGNCTRAQVVTFLWRAAGEPNPKSTSCKFKDVDKNAYYYKAMLWAVENGITTGTSATKFNPNGKCSRAQVVTFLWRAAGEPNPKSTSSPFKDVDKTAFYYKAMLWAVEREITAGTSGTTFSPDKTCTRGQVVTFLYRADGVA